MGNHRLGVDNFNYQMQDSEKIKSERHKRKKQKKTKRNYNREYVRATKTTISGITAPGQSNGLSESHHGNHQVL